MYKNYIFDWGGTIMVDYPHEKGPMYKWNKVTLIANAEKTLNELVLNSSHCYLATNARDSSKDDIIKALKRVNIDKYFSGIYCFKDIGFDKPSPEYFEYIIKSIGTREECLLIGDSLTNDIKGAIDSGISAVLYDPLNRQTGYKGKKIKDLIEVLDL